MLWLSAFHLDDLRGGPLLAVEVTTYQQLIDALIARRAELQITLAELDTWAGLSDRHCSKLMSSKPTKFLGPISLSCLLAALGLKLVVSVDEAAAARIERRLMKRRPGPVHRVRHAKGRSGLGETQDSSISPAAI
jgi:hypothetical protein